jgi:hypothetical protein
VHEYEMRGSIVESPDGFSLDLSYVDREGASKRTEVVCRRAGPDESFEIDCELDQAWPNPVQLGFRSPTLRFGAR